MKKLKCFKSGDNPGRSVAPQFNKLLQLTLAVCFYLFCFQYQSVAETIKTKKGDTATGRIIEFTRDHVKLELSPGKDLTFPNNEIQAINGILFHIYYTKTTGEKMDASGNFPASDPPVPDQWRKWSSQNIDEVITKMENLQEISNQNQSQIKNFLKIVKDESARMKRGTSADHVAEINLKTMEEIYSHIDQNIENMGTLSSEVRNFPENPKSVAPTNP